MNQQTIIRRKRSEGEEEHHGGVWKLAFADFMTAMMAFFLVMWLINSTSKETKAVVVQYFNPVRLVDSTNANKGLRDASQGEGKQAGSPAKGLADGKRDIEDALHAEPLKQLDDIAAHDRPPTAVAPEAGFFRDPFDRPSIDPPSSPRKKVSDDGARTVANLQAEIEKAAGQEARSPKIEVKQTDEGVLISLTDNANFSMFAVGSIEPRPQLVRIIGQVAKILATRRGELEIRGHTDGRAYASKNYDNWRLSTDRGTIVQYMLLRGGLSSTRIGKIVGFADRRLKMPDDPLAAVNRRIEILLRETQP